MKTAARRRLATLIAIAVVAVVVAGCGSSETASTTKQPVSIALDWTPNTNHIGIFAAQQLGYYKDAGLNVKVLPYANTAPETLVARGKADFGVGNQAGIAYARASGQDVLQVMANIAKTQYAIGVRADDKAIQSPKDLDGKTYAGFGTPDEGPELEYVIKDDGGSGKFKTVTLNTTAYEAVYNGKADFTIAVTTWEGIQARLLGKPMRFFEFTNYGFPTQYSSVIESSDKYLGANSETAKQFLAATQKGYEYAQSNPVEAAKLLVAANPQTIKDAKLARESALLLANDGYYKGSGGKIGPVDAAIWKNYGSFLYSSKLLTGADGKPLASEPDWSKYFTNAYLPGS
ncbi:MAG: ABC transporter permease [Actinobacteria bacterium]|uniref:Thiamine pyrimidine synthase n=1 Tax=freshwater metagenome TaxID=449393 RepID=A0A6J5ZZ54_9ZZZZ|nr:ABC transporter permease [Actinomycetota bacterium]